MQSPLTIDTMGELDNGAARAIVNAAIKAAVADLDDRGEDGKSRSVVITLEMGRLDNGLVASHVSAQVKLPARRTNSTLGMVQTRGGQSDVLFQTLAPDDPNQRTMDELEEKK